jgi:mono/diheme cytochrome c family protein
MKGFVGGVIFTLLVITSGVFGVSHFGLYPIGADNPPGALERSLASRAMDEYAAKHKPSGGNPVQLTPANLMTGAKQYELRCAFCHGGATAKISPMRDKFNPPAPQLINRIPHDDDSWLFWVTKHGVRMTGMPTWGGILSDDEMWSIIAFIKHSDKLPPDVQSYWQRMAATPGEIEEHTPEQHSHPPGPAHPAADRSNR